MGHQARDESDARFTAYVEGLASVLGRAALMFTLTRTAKLNDLDHQAWLADVLVWIADHKKNTDLAALRPWNWRRLVPVARAA